MNFIDIFMRRIQHTTNIFPMLRNFHPLSLSIDINGQFATISMLNPFWRVVSSGPADQGLKNQYSDTSVENKVVNEGSLRQEIISPTTPRATAFPTTRITTRLPVTGQQEVYRLSLLIVTLLLLPLFESFLDLSALSFHLNQGNASRSKRACHRSHNRHKN